MLELLEIDGKTPPNISAGTRALNGAPKIAAVMFVPAAKGAKVNVKVIKFIALIIFVIAAFFLFRWDGLSDYLDQDTLRNWIDGFGVWGPLVYLLIYSIAPSFMMPGLPITVIGGILFGPLWGTIYVLIGATIGASIAFLIARYMGRDWIAGVIKGGRFEELDGKVEKQGWKIVAFTRLIPLFPFNFLNYAFGLTKIKFSHYVLASFIFMMPGAIAYVVFSSSILDVFKGKVSKEFLIGVILVILVSLLPVIYKRFKGSRRY
ncbi:MAG: TVP38/TMEM64 family protein [Deltaproteobacteria bacterium]|nr:TVP38/TMEM64 family protein [Deltaproteobacteria bacterium]